MILIDSNTLIVLLLGLIDPKLLKTHKTTSIYDEEDFFELLRVIEDFNQIIVLPNIWTEVDNLLNSFGGNYKYQYILRITELIKNTSENYIDSITGSQCESFFDLGLTDSIVLEQAKTSKLLITSDSKLSDYAISYGIKVYDLVKVKNEKLK
jgi:rRNA-processing protein FCF1